MLLLQNYFDRRNITDSAVKKEVNDVKSEAENDDEIEKLPPEQLLSDVEKILESLAMKGVEIVPQPPTLRKRVLSMFIVVLSLVCMYVCMYERSAFLQSRNYIRTRSMESVGWCICFRKACR